MADSTDFERRLELIEQGVRAIEAAPDAGLRAAAQQLVQAILALHESTLERLLEIVHASGGAGQEIIDRLGRDPLVSKLLLLHALHPLPLEARVLHALDTLRPQVRSQGGDVELLGIVDGAVRVRVVGASGLKSSVERAILDAAPDAAALEVEAPAEGADVVSYVSLESLRGGDPTRPPPRTPLLAPTARS